jgi:hypothetical protein
MSAVASRAFDRHQARSEPGHAGASVRVRALTAVLLIAAIVSLLAAVPGLHKVAGEIAHLDLRWLVLASALELASCASFVIVFRHFFTGIAARPAREVA